MQQRAKQQIVSEVHKLVDQGSNRMLDVTGRTGLSRVSYFQVLFGSDNAALDTTARYVSSPQTVRPRVKSHVKRHRASQSRQGKVGLAPVRGSDNAAVDTTARYVRSPRTS